MSGSFDKTASLILAVRTADGTASQLSSEFKEAVNTAVQSVQPEIQKLGAYLCKAFDVAQPMAQAQKAFSDLLKEASRGRFMEDHIQQVMRLRDTFTQVGDAQRKFLADGLLNVHGNASGRAGFSPQQQANQFASWQIANTMGGQPNPQFDRMKIEDSIFKGFQKAGDAARVVAHAEQSRIRAEQESVDLARRTANANATVRRAYRHADDEMASDAIVRRQRTERFDNLDEILSSRVGDRSLYHADRRAYNRIRGLRNTIQPDVDRMNDEYENRSASDRMLSGMGEVGRELMPEMLSKRKIAGHNLMANLLRNAGEQSQQDRETLSASDADYRSSLVRKGNALRGYPPSRYPNMQEHYDLLAGQRVKEQQEETVRLSAKYARNNFPSPLAPSTEPPNLLSVKPDHVMAAERYYDRDVIFQKKLDRKERDAVDSHADYYYSAVHGPKGSNAQTNALITEMMESNELKMNPGGKKPFHAGHNFRFAAQNLGFGIDDAIQSYHYGGIGASIRAASNNVTAIAGMTIPNPAAAAGAVVALSIASAVLPSVLKRYGIDEEMTKAASMRYQSTGAAAGRAKRNETDVSDVNEKINALFSVKDQFHSDQEMSQVARKNIRKYWKGDANKIPLGYSMMLSGEAKSEFDAAQAYVSAEGTRDMQTHSKFNQANRELNKLLGTNFAVQESGRQLKTAGDRDLYRADSLGDYNMALRRNYDVRVAHIDGTVKDIDDRNRQKQLEEYRYKDQVARTEENSETVVRNRTARHRSQEDFVTSMYTGDNQVSATTQRYKRVREDVMNDKSLGQIDRVNRLAAITAGESRYSGYAWQDEIRAISGNASAIGDTTIAYQRRRDQYGTDPNLNPKQRETLLRANDVGFQRQRSDMMSDMMSDRVNNPVGYLQASYVKAATSLQKQLDDGFITAGESNTLSTNLKTKYAYELKQASIPSGTERFVSNASTVGSGEDRELQARMLGTFTKRTDDAKLSDLLKMSLDEFKLHTKSLEEINAKLEAVRSGL